MSPRRPLRLLLITLALAAVGGALAWWRVAPKPLAVVAPTRGPAVDAVFATGLVEPSLEIRVSPRLAGKLVALQVDEGARVRRGDVLARLEDADLRATVAELESRERYARSQAERLIALRERGLVSVDTAERARADLDAAAASLARAREQRSFMTLRAPADGKVTRREGEVGDLIPVNQVLFYLAGDAPLRVAADVDEEDLPRVAVGQRALVRTDAFPQRVFEGVVQEITPRGDPVSRSYRIRVALTDAAALRIGMTAEVNIIIDERSNALLVPSGALREGRVYVIDNGRLVAREVIVGVRSPDRTEILSGLNDQDRVVAPLPEKLPLERRVKAVSPP